MKKQTIILQMKKNAKKNGYYLCPDQELFNNLIDGLIKNSKRYRYGSCPCRIASGVKKYDIDIICPCEYRNADVDEFGMCYCGLFVNEQIKNNPSQMRSIPERRPQEISDIAFTAEKTRQTSGKSIMHKKPIKSTSSPMKIWRCSVCGYLCARELPPPICPICKAKAEYFEPFILRSTRK